jgi:Mrp family chromosome partitioning ATPase
MTTTNRAFIKAYRTDDAQAAPASPVIAGDARSQGPAAGPATQPAATKSTSTTSNERSALYGPRPIQTQHVATTPPSEKRPLSSFIASTGIARLDSDPAEGDFFRPGTTVASFHWPEVCRILSRHYVEQSSRVADLLVTHAAAGRSLVAVVGMSRACGATTMALCLASRLAERRRRVVLVDGNFRRPQLATTLEAVPTAGWQDVLKHGAPLTDAVVRATDDRIDLLALGDKVPNDPVRLVAGLQAVVTAGVLRHAYDHVLIDAGAFSDAKSQPIMLELIHNMGVDAAIAITDPLTTDMRGVETLAEQLSRSGCELLGTIQNRVNCLSS